uniref:GCN5-like N-acetyltransferase n=1 Tax=Calliarthron tuberculosum TaxID=48942 RepID=M4IUW1_CALTB|nr:GCN5-like N-acetyltransferase [Calliarthron tuberculosum]AGA63769.1 GCN5-like N-acetyltransferase [Calliarthron tuberculosum]
MANFMAKKINISINQNASSKSNYQNNIIIQDFNYKNQQISIFLSQDKNIDLYELEKLCDTVGWVRRPLKKVKTAIKHSFLTISLFYKNKNQVKMIAFARATSDHTFNATIWDVVVHPEFQRKGLGKVLIYEVIKELRYSDINTITLFADPQVISFYKNLGFIPDPDGVKGMFWYPN